MATNIYTQINGKHRHTHRLLALVLTLCCSALFLHAYDFEVDGIYYNVNTSDNTASVTYKYKSNGYYVDYYSGAVNIPEEVAYNGTTYRVTSIGDYAFYCCDRLTQVIIPNSVTLIGNDAFVDCRGLKQLTIPNSVTSIGGGVFAGCRGLTELTIPNSVTSIGNDAFSECRGLKQLTIPNSVTSIGEFAFYGCRSLTQVTIGNSVTSIGYYAFAGCDSILSITVLKETPPTIAESTFSNTTYETAALHVPDESMIYYKMDQYWRYFYNIKEDALTGIDGVSADNEDDKQGEETVIYTLNGVRLFTTSIHDLPKGIYIVNGKKVAVK